jgi:pyruvate-ferredoxin/flavodoxin oxidoreductase
MHEQLPLVAAERENFNFFNELPFPDRSKVKLDAKNVQFLEPLFEFSGACAGCGETPYVKLLTQLFGDRSIIANATGCSSIYGGNLPTTPYTQNADGRGPSWSNSLFEDNAEFGLGIRVGVDQLATEAARYLKALAPTLGDDLAAEILNAPQATEADLAAQRKRVLALRGSLASLDTPEARRLSVLADYLVKKCIWIVGGDGWAYDIGFGGLDHVIASGRNVNILVLDTEVYSNTGGQCSKSTPLGALAKFSANGKPLAKKDLGLMALTYGSVYVARVALGAKDAQTVKAFVEAESFDGPSLIIAYSHCIAHGFNLSDGMNQQKLLVDTGAWPLFRYDPRRDENGDIPLQLDSPAPKIALSDYTRNELRFQGLSKQDPERAALLGAKAQEIVRSRFELYEALAKFSPAAKPERNIAPAQA